MDAQIKAGSKPVLLSGGNPQIAYRDRGFHDRSPRESYR